MHEIDTAAGVTHEQTTCPIDRSLDTRSCFYGGCLEDVKVIFFFLDKVPG